MVVRGWMSFQSAPGFSAGRNNNLRANVCGPPRFNPLPAFRPGETELPCANRGIARVSIRSRLFGREKRKDVTVNAGAGGVSIRSRLFGREKRPQSAAGAKTKEFQSAPGFSAGRNRVAGRPGQATGAVSIRSRLFGREKRLCWGLRNVAQDVSIRSRLFGREKPHVADLVGDATIRFQSAPGFSAGRNYSSTRLRTVSAKFQSAPGFSAGRNRQSPTREVGRHRFQSAPGFSAGRNDYVQPVVTAVSGFNPLPAFRPGETDAGLVVEPVAGNVSIRSRLFGREKHA